MLSGDIRLRIDQAETRKARGCDKGNKACYMMFGRKCTELSPKVRES